MCCSTIGLYLLKVSNLVVLALVDKIRAKTLKKTYGNMSSINLLQKMNVLYCRSDYVSKYMIRGVLLCAEKDS